MTERDLIHEGWKLWDAYKTVAWRGLMCSAVVHPNWMARIESEAHAVRKAHIKMFAKSYG